MQATVDGVVTPFTVDPHIDGFGRAPTIVGDGELNDDDSTTVYRITDGTFDILGDR